MATPALTSVSLSAGQWVSCQPNLSLCCRHSCKFGRILCGVWLGMCKCDMSVCDALIYSPFCRTHRCGPYKSVHGNASQSSHLSSFHASLSSSACVVRHASVSLCVRFCIKICCFIMEWLSFILLVFESVCVFRIDSGFSMKRFLSEMEDLIIHYSKKWFVSPSQLWFTGLNKSHCFQFFVYVDNSIVQSFSNF